MAILSGCDYLDSIGAARLRAAIRTKSRSGWKDLAETWDENVEEVQKKLADLGEAAAKETEKATKKAGKRANIADGHDGPPTKRSTT
ncbi:hypothetical protein GGS26DRAFT_592089 [Hypomontagnella submonticulosa]|nr:hypothetical protein GGS26DRAFT_592089 [Hypomontagnella submonticulosa]